MAIAFELVADFADDKDAADHCRQWLESRIMSVEIDQFTINLHQPLIAGYPHANPTCFKVSVIPANVGCRVALDESDERIQLDDHQLSRLGTHLYDLLRGAPGYQLAMVGWDVDFLLDVDELKSDWASEIRDGSFDGLVVNKSLVHRLPASEYFTDFDDEHIWLPYTGSEAV